MHQPTQRESNLQSLRIGKNALRPQAVDNKAQDATPISPACAWRQMVILPPQTLLSSHHPQQASPYNFPRLPHTCNPNTCVPLL